MAVRSVKLKLKTHTGREAEQLRKGLWRTHQLINEGIAYYMNWLVLMRQEPIGDRPKADIQLELMAKIREQQKRNNWTGGAKDAEILPLLRQLYELIVPSSTGNSGDAQILSRNFINPLTNPNSVGGKGISKAGRKPGWLLKKEAGDPTWEEDQKKVLARKDADPTSTILQGLEAVGLKPLLPLFTDNQSNIEWIPKNKRQFVRPWDYNMLQQAIERMLSWESWNRRIIEERRKLHEKTENFRVNHLSDDAEWIGGLEAYQANRQSELAHESFTPVADFRITPRQVRGWDRVYEKWSKLQDNAGADELWGIVANVQKEMSSGFGDPKLFKYLAEPENRYIWLNHPERLFHFGAYNKLLKKLERAKEQATFTRPDAIKHPLWIRYDARGGNIHSYTIRQNGPKHLTVILDSMLWPADNGQWVEKKNIEVPLAPSKQLNNQFKILDNAGEKQEIIYTDYSSQVPLKGVLGGSKIQFDRSYLEKNAHKIVSGDIGPIFFNLVMDLEPLQELKNGRLRTPIGQTLKVVNADWPKVIDYKPEGLSELIQTTPSKISLGVDSLTTGMRIMSVDMGQRTAAAVSIFEVVKEKPTEATTKLYYAVKDTGLYAVHRRSLLLHLPGEDITQKIFQGRGDRRTVFLSIKAQVRSLADILRLHTKVINEEREKALGKLTETVNSWTNAEKDLWLKELDSLKKLVNTDGQEWIQALELSHHRLEIKVGQAVSLWRRSLSKDRRGLAGLSMWNIEELEETRKILLSWSKRARVPGEVKRIDREEKFAPNLLAHIQNVKDDRLKQMANLIVMTALGYKYDEQQKSWKEAYPACQVILFEDLSRYLFSLDRPRRENSKLMKWAHRSIPKMVYQQAELYGIQVGDVRSEFSSRFHAKTGAPGIRCHSLTEEDLKEGSFILKDLVEDEFLNAEEVSLLKPGDIVPRQGGELFITLAASWREGGNNKLSVIHADINAAQNLQKRFWQQNSELFRVPCQMVTKECTFFIPKSQSKLLQKHLGNGRFIEIPGFSDVYKWENHSKIKMDAKVMGEEVSDLEDLEEFQQAVEDAQEIRGGYKTLFRDPSGYFFNKDTWRPQKDFWNRVKSIIEKQLRTNIKSRK